MHKAPSSVKNARSIALALWGAVLLVQLCWWMTLPNALLALLTLMGGTLGTMVFARREVLRRYPISASMMLGYTSYYFLLPPIATLLEGKPLSNNLEAPELVGIHAVACVLFLVAAHLLYRRLQLLQSIRWLVSERFYRPAGLFTTPSNMHLLAIGGVGLAAMGMQVFIPAADSESAASILSKVVQGLYPLAYVPYCILLRVAMGGEDRRVGRKWGAILAVYSLMILAIALGLNSRAAFLQGIASIGLVYGYCVGVGMIRTRLLTTRKVVLAVLGMVILAGPVVDLALSMVLVRGERTNVSATELVLRTLESYQNKDAIHQLRSHIGGDSDWDEHYVENPFLARLANLKYADNGIQLASDMSESQRSQFASLEAQKVLSVFPTPLIEVLGLPADKTLVGSASVGDLMLYVATGNSYALGGFRTGSIFGSGYALFGWVYLAVWALGAIVIFILGDSLTSRALLAKAGLGAPLWMPVLAPIAIVGFFTWAFYFTSAATGAESMSVLMNYIIRGWIQVAFVYAFGYWVTYFPVRLVSTGHGTRRRPSPLTVTGRG